MSAVEVSSVLYLNIHLRLRGCEVLVIVVRLVVFCSSRELDLCVTLAHFTQFDAATEAVAALTLDKWSEPARWSGEAGL